MNIVLYFTIHPKQKKERYGYKALAMVFVHTTMCDRFDATQITDSSAILIVGSPGTRKTTLLYQLNDLGIHCIVSTKEKLGLTAIENYEYVFVFSMEYESDFNSLYHQYSTMSALPPLTMEEFHLLYTEVCRNDRCLVLDMRKLACLEGDPIYWYSVEQSV
jgi:hypothetical protein